MNQMANQFKILVEIDGQKYTVLVKTDFKLITFRKVCNEINCQTEQNVSFESHVFEVHNQLILLSFLSFNLFLVFSYLIEISRNML